MRHFPIAGEGFWVFPCVYGRKEPATKRGFYDASANPATIRRWFGGNFRCNLAVRTGNISGVWVLDVDDPQPLRVLEKSHGLLPVTRQSQSSRGYHFWFRTTGAPIPNSTSRIAANVDVKSENGYVIVAPSRHPDGVIYRWLNDEPLAVAPEWLVALARKPSPPPPLPASTTPPIGGGVRLAAMVRQLCGQKFRPSPRWRLIPDAITTQQSFVLPESTCRWRRVECRRRRGCSNRRRDCQRPGGRGWYAPDDGDHPQRRPRWPAASALSERGGGVKKAASLTKRKALDLSRRGSALICTNWSGWCVAPGGRQRRYCQEDKDRPDVLGQQDALFPGLDQTWRMLGARHE